MTPWINLRTNSLTEPHSKSFEVSRQDASRMDSQECTLQNTLVQTEAERGRREAGVQQAMENGLRFHPKKSPAAIIFRSAIILFSGEFLNATVSFWDKK